MKRPVFFLIFILSLLPFFSIACSRNPNVRKQKHFTTGVGYLDAQKLDEASIEFRNAIEIDPAFAEAHYKLGLVYLKKAQWPRASQELSRAIDLQPANHSARIELTRLLIAAGGLQQAQEHLDWLLKQRPGDAETHLLNADLLAAQGRLPAALQEAQKAASLEPANADAYLKLALMELKSDQSDAAESNFKRAIELSPTATAARLMLANYYRMRSRFAEAEEQLRAGIQKDRGNPEPTAALARLYLAEGKSDQAENLLIGAKHDFPDSSSGYRMLGDFYLGIGELEKATAEYKNLYENHHKDLQVKKNYADLLLHTNRFHDASKINDEILRADPNDSDGLIYQGELQVHDGDSSAAIRTFQTVLKNDPDNGLAHYHSGLAFQKSGNLERAESEWRDAVRLRPELVDPQRELAILSMRRGDMTTLSEASSQIIALRPASADGYVLRAVSEINRKQFAAAEADARKAIDVTPASAAGYVQLGNLNFAQKRFSEAQSIYRQALDRDPRSNDALRGLMNTYVAMKQTDSAIAAANVQIAKVQDNSGFYDLLGTVLFQHKKDFNGAKIALQKSAQLDRNNSDALMKLGQLQEATGQTEEAIRTYQQGASDNPHEASFHIFLGQIFQSRRDWSDAVRAYEKALAIRQDDPVAACNLAYVTVQMGGDLDVALSLAQTARRKMPQSPDAADTLGWIYYQKGAYRPAVESLQAAVALVQQGRSPDNPRFHYHLGMAYGKVGEAAHAREQFQKLVKMDPDSAEAAEATKQLSHFKS